MSCVFQINRNIAIKGEKKKDKFGQQVSAMIVGQPTLNTPASVSTRPLATPTKKTAAMFSKKATSALLKKMAKPTFLSS